MHARREREREIDRERQRERTQTPPLQRLQPESSTPSDDQVLGSYSGAIKALLRRYYGSIQARLWLFSPAPFKSIIECSYLRLFIINIRLLYPDARRPSHFFLTHARTHAHTHTRTHTHTHTLRPGARRASSLSV
jgi:hypothetical protein